MNKENPWIFGGALGLDLAIAFTVSAIPIAYLIEHLS